ncbi:MAG: hypothetical protein HOD92_25385 [Deltaproteobacteria bacterium]|jgi:hypothetical protein|nr:hypothetical protein [Deltaproteobacteria bacterium]MBT4527256.1 hypothetical protein [Deltaproteobacteria bacterium]
MWRLLSVIAAVTSFVSVFLYWSKRKQLFEDDHYYLYGDSQYQEPPNDYSKIDKSSIANHSKIQEESVKVSNLVN